MPNQPSHTISPSTDLTDAVPEPLLDHFHGWAIAYMIGMKLAFLLVLIPLPFVPFTSVTQIILEILAIPFSGHSGGYPPNDGFRAYLFLSTTIAFVLSYPVILRRALDVGAPLKMIDHQRRLTVTLIASLIAFVVGAVVWIACLLPLFIRLSVSWNPIEISFLWTFTEYIVTVTTLLVVSGVACHLPALMTGMVWLRIARRERLAKWRPYAILAAFVVGAWVTPTPDMLNQAVVAVPICLLYELGLLLARRVPNESAQPTV
jgi:sec-independent protein translocase protein TatC